MTGYLLLDTRYWFLDTGYSLIAYLVTALVKAQLGKRSLKPQAMQKKTE
jgi:hypothetical protein